MKTIIRIEHKSGKGLFRAIGNDGYALILQHPNFDKIEQRHNDFDKFPTFYSDTILKNKVKERYGYTDIISEYLFSFKSLEQLATALTSSELQYCINELEFSVYMIEVSDCIESPYQIVYKPEHIIEKKNINFMFL